MTTDAIDAPEKTEPPKKAQPEKVGLWSYIKTNWFGMK